MRQAVMIILLLFTLEGSGQDLIRLTMDVQNVSEKVSESLGKPRFYPDSLSLRQGLDSALTFIQTQGYIEARLEDFQTDTMGYRAQIHAGPLYHWQLENFNISTEALREQKLARYFEGTRLPFPAYQDLQEKIIAWYEDQGYPFASLQAEAIKIEGQTLQASLKVDPSYRIVYDTLRLSGDVSLSSGFLSTHTGIRPGSTYNETKARNAAALIAELPFVQVNSEPSLQFTPGTALLTIPVRKRPANRFDGIAGVSSNSLDENRLQLTGQVNLSLVNLMSRGEQFAMIWQGLGQGTQRLTLDASYPYIFSTPFISSWLFSLHKQDTAYLNLRNRPSFTWTSPRRIQVSVFADLQSTELLSTSRFSGTSTLPPQIDSRTRLYGIEGAIFSQGFSAGLMDGHGLKVSLAAGSRNIRENANLPEAIFEGLAMKQNQYSFGVEAETRLPLGQKTRLVFHLDARGLSSQQYFENELYRIGGFNSLKGFDEDAILASLYGIMTSEVRYFTGEQTFFSLLFNAGYFERDITGNAISGWPWGAAAGITLETAPGIISVYYAIGHGPETTLAFRNAKIHIGFVSLF
ncbi:MAG: hypothetical protein V2I46_08515 [Bacteroides sp.]|jgi:hypothetical protein|nr:hypothetical protein [Bacteroides sp.]